MTGEAERTIPAVAARAWWKALIDNALGLLEDAHVLVLAGSAGRAQALQILAMEELAKAVWLYESAAEDWTQQKELARIGDAESRAVHLAKLTKSLTYDAGLEPFWGDYNSWKLPDVASPDGFLEHLGELLTSYQGLAVELNSAKQAGFYVDRVEDKIQCPANVQPHGLNASIERTADLILMALIRDHTRMKHEMPADAYDSTSELQWRAMAMAHAEETEEYFERNAGSP